MVNTSISPALGGEPDLGAGGSADPVALHGLDLLRPVQHVEILEQPVGVGGDAHHPLPQPLPEHREVAAVAAAVGGDLLVGQHRAEPGAPVDHRVGPVHQPVRVDQVRARIRRQRRPLRAVAGAALSGLELGHQLVDAAGPVEVLVEPRVVDLQEDPLRPLVELDVGGGETAPRVVAQPEPAQLTAEVDDVGLGPDARMGAGLHRVLLGGQAERVEAQRVQHIAARHPEVAGVDVGGDVAERVPDVQPLTRRVGEHVLDEHLVGGHRRSVRRRQRPHRVGHVEGALLRPRLLPGTLDLPGQRRGVSVLGGVGSNIGGVGDRLVAHVNRVKGRRRPPFGHGQVSVALRSGQSFIPARFQAWWLTPRAGYSRRLTRGTSCPAQSGRTREGSGDER